MAILRLAWKNIRGNGFRSLAILASAALVASMALSATFVVRGAEAGLRANLKRLGADILILPWGTMTQKIQGIRLMSAAIDRWMPRSYLYKVSALEGVEAVSPQQYLAALEESEYSPYPHLYLVAFDPATDFTLTPWLKGGEVQELAMGEALGGAHVAHLPVGEDLNLYGVDLKLSGRLEETQTTIDDTLFVSFETAAELIASSRTYGGPPLDVMEGTISAMMVRLDLGSDPHEVSLRILEKLPGMVPLETPNMFQAERAQMIGVLRTLLATLGVTWALLVAFMGLIFSISVNARSYEIGVLRALGFTSHWVLRALLTESALLALVGGTAGLALTSLGFALFGDAITQTTRLPLSVPSPLGLISLSAAGQSMALISVILAAFFPAYRISREEAALAMRA